MEIHLAPEIEVRLQQMAVSQGKALPQVVEETVTRAWQMLQDQDAWLLTHREDLREDIRIGLAELDSGQAIPDYELDAALARLKYAAE